MWYQLDADSRVIGLMFEEPALQDSDIWFYTTFEFPENFEDYVLVDGEFIKQPREEIQPASASEVIEALVQNSPETVLPLIPDSVVSRMYNFFPNWAENTQYTKNTVISYEDVLYKCLIDHNSSSKSVPDSATKYWELVVK